MSKPTAQQFATFEAMFAHFNKHLFGGTLPACMLNFSRKNGTRGFFAPERWEERNAKDGSAPRHEISINPSTLKDREPRDVASTLVHEMCHLWQQEHGTPSRAGYHNAEWSAKMIAIGLTPTSTGEPGGPTVGQRMTHLIVDGGPFDRAFDRLGLGGDEAFPWLCGEPTKEKAAKKTPSKVKYTCDGCESNAWGKPGLVLLCGECEDEDGEHLAYTAETA